MPLFASCCIITCTHHKLFVEIPYLRSSRGHLLILHLVSLNTHDPMRKPLCYSSTYFVQTFTEDHTSHSVTFIYIFSTAFNPSMSDLAMSNLAAVWVHLWRDLAVALTEHGTDISFRAALLSFCVFTTADSSLQQPGSPDRSLQEASTSVGQWTLKKKGRGRFKM